MFRCRQYSLHVRRTTDGDGRGDRYQTPIILPGHKALAYRVAGEPDLSVGSVSTMTLVGNRHC